MPLPLLLFQRFSLLVSSSRRRRRRGPFRTSWTICVSSSCWRFSSSVGAMPQDFPLSLRCMSSMHSRAVSAPPLEPDACTGEQAWLGTCSLPRSSDDDAEGTRFIPSAPGLGHPTSPVPVSLYSAKDFFIFYKRVSASLFSAGEARGRPRPPTHPCCRLSHRDLRGHGVTSLCPLVSVGLAGPSLAVHHVCALKEKLES